MHLYVLTEISLLDANKNEKKNRLMPAVIIVHRYDKMNLIVNHIDCKYTGYN